MTKVSQDENVQPIRSKEDIAEFIKAIEITSPRTAKRNVLLFKLGISTGLRIGDIVKLRVEDVKGRSNFIIYEGKTKKPRTVHIGAIMPEIADYIDGLKADTGYLFASRKGGYITPTQAYRVLDKAADALDWDFIGTHTMRKTFGYHYYQQYKDIVTLSEIFNHASQQVTRRYIGIREEEIGDTLRTFRLF